MKTIIIIIFVTGTIFMSLIVNNSAANAESILPYIKVSNKNNNDSILLTPETGSTSDYFYAVNSLHKQVTSLRQELKASKELNEQYKHLAETSFNNISAQIEASNLTLSLVGLLFALIGIGISVGGYWLNKRVRETRDEIKEYQTASEDVYKRFKKLEKKINQNIDSIYDQIQRVRIVRLIERYTKHPEEIGNHLHEFLAYDFSNELYPDMKNMFLVAYDKFKDNKNAGIFSNAYSEAGSLLLLKFSNELAYDKDTYDKTVILLDFAISAANVNEYKQLIKSRILLWKANDFDNYKSEISAISRATHAKHQKNIEFMPTFISILSEYGMLYRYTSLLYNNMQDYKDFYRIPILTYIVESDIHEEISVSDSQMITMLGEYLVNLRDSKQDSEES